jgi:hypothetical protein
MLFFEMQEIFAPAHKRGSEMGNSPPAAVGERIGGDGPPRAPKNLKNFLGGLRWWGGLYAIQN